MTGGEAHEVKGYDALMELHDINPDRLLGEIEKNSDAQRDGATRDNRNRATSCKRLRKAHLGVCSAPLLQLAH